MKIIHSNNNISSFRTRAKSNLAILEQLGGDILSIREKHHLRIELFEMI